MRSCSLLRKPSSAPTAVSASNSTVGTAGSVPEWSWGEKCAWASQKQGQSERCGQLFTSPLSASGCEKTLTNASCSAKQYVGQCVRLHVF